MQVKNIMRKQSFRSFLKAAKYPVIKLSISVSNMQQHL